MDNIVKYNMKNQNKLCAYESNSLRIEVFFR